MIFHKIEFIKSAAGRDGFIKPEKPMIAVCGRSNVGKSSFINMLAQRNKLAKTSQTPGRTRLVNYFDFEHFVLADLPGYGFAEVSKTEKDKWGILLDEFFSMTEDISHVFALVDIRHKPSQEDMQMIHFLYGNIFPFTIIATKADKLGKTQVKPKLKELANYLNLGVMDIMPVSSTEKKGRDEVLEKIEKIISVYNDTEIITEIETETDPEN
jgi:GTP-binding protein